MSLWTMDRDEVKAIGTARGSKRLAEQKRCRHRERRHDVEAHLTAKQAAQDFDQERG